MGSRRCLVLALAMFGLAIGAGGARLAAQNFPPVKVTLAVGKPEINPGDTTTLSWTTESAVSCRFDPPAMGPNPVPPNGSVTIKPPRTTTYRLTCQGSGGPASRQ